MMLQTLSGAAFPPVQYLVCGGDEVLNRGEAAGNHVAVAGVLKSVEQPVFNVRPFDQLAVGIGDDELGVIVDGVLYHTSSREHDLRSRGIDFKTADEPLDLRLLPQLGIHLVNVDQTVGFGGAQTEGIKELVDLVLGVQHERLIILRRVLHKDKKSACVVGTEVRKAATEVGDAVLVAGALPVIAVLLTDAIIPLRISSGAR